MVTDTPRYNGRMRLTPVLLFLAGSALLRAGDAEDLLLRRARVHMSGLLNSLPNYTCLLTTQRYLQLPKDKRPEFLDRLRLEVALADGRELFAFPGSGRFSEAELRDLIPGGASGTGSFGLHAKAVFQSAAPVFTFEGREMRNGRSALVWSFVVTQERSSFILRAGKREGEVGYSGRIFVDEKSLDAVRLEIRADEIPAFLRIRAASDSVELDRIRLGEESFLLPVRAELQMTSAEGYTNINRTSFSACKQYRGESTLIFDDVESGAASSAPEEELEAPPGLKIELETRNALDLDSAALGDAVDAILTRPLVLPGGITAPRGSLVRGHILHLRRARFPRQSAIGVGIQFSEIQAGRRRIRMTTALEEISSPVPWLLTRVPPMAARAGVGLGNATILGSIFFVKDNTNRIPRGLPMTWRTTAGTAEDTR